MRKISDWYSESRTSACVSLTGGKYGGSSRIMPNTGVRVYDKFVWNQHFYSQRQIGFSTLSKKVQGREVCRMWLVLAALPFSMMPYALWLAWYWLTSYQTYPPSSVEIETARRCSLVIDPHITVLQITELSRLLHYNCWLSMDTSLHTYLAFDWANIHAFQSAGSV